MKNRPRSSPGDQLRMFPYGIDRDRRSAARKVFGRSAQVEFTHTRQKHPLSSTATLSHCMGFDDLLLEMAKKYQILALASHASSISEQQARSRPTLALYLLTLN